MSTARGFLGAGDVYIGRYDSGTTSFLPYQGPYEATKFEAKANTKLVEMVSRGKTTYGQIVESVPLQEPTEFSIELGEVNKESMTLALLGTQASYTQAGTAVTDEAVTVALGAWKPLANHSLTDAAVTVTHTSGTPTYVEGTDYEVNRTLGWIKALVGGAIADAASVKVDYTCGTIAGTRIRGATNAQLRAKVLFDGVNLADSSPCVVECWEAVISSSSAFDFLSDNFNKVPLVGRLKTPSGKTEPFEVRLPQG